MTKVLIDGGRTADLTDADPNGTIGDLAAALAEGSLHPGGIFSLKVGGTLVHPDTRAGDVALHDDHVIELVEVTDQNWDDHPAVLEVGVPHDNVDDEDELPDDDDDPDV